MTQYITVDNTTHTIFGCDNTTGLVFSRRGQPTQASFQEKFHEVADYLWTKYRIVKIEKRPNGARYIIQGTPNL